jgi:hemolysin III
MGFSWFVPMAELPVWFDGEEIANSVSHWFGCGFALVASWVLMRGAVATRNTKRIVGCAIFCSSLFLTFACSSIYHGLKDPSWKTFFRYLDYVSVYMLIAGSYTPFLLKSGGTQRCILVWAIGFLGATLTILRFDAFEKYSLGYFVVMGWIALPVFSTLFKLWNRATLCWMIASGASYTFGIYFLMELWPYAHALWHLFVIGGGFSTTMAIHYDH